MMNFHRVLITTAIIFCTVFAVWSFREWQGTHSAFSGATAGAFALFAVGLSVYLANLKRFLKT